MKIIDMRLRPPYGSFLNPSQQIFKRDFSEPFAKSHGVSFPESAIERSLDLCLKEMDEAGITKGVVPVRVSQGCSNEDMAQLLVDFPERFIGMAGVLNNDIEGGIRDIDKYVVNGPYTGVFLEPSVSASGNLGDYANTKFADDPELYPIYETCQAKNIPILISFGGFTAPDFSYNNPIHIDKVARNFPHLKMILAHAAWPFVTEICFVAAQRANVYISPDCYMVNSIGQTDYALAANYRLRDKVIFGSAYPVFDLKSAVEQYNKLLRPEAIEDVMYNNAMRALGLEK